MSPATSSGSGPIVLPSRITAGTSRGRRDDRRQDRRARVAHRRSGDHGLRGLLQPRGVRQEDDVGVDQRLQARRDVVVDLEPRGDRAHGAAAPLEDRRGDDVEELAVDEPDPLRGLALEGGRDRRDVPHVPRVGEGLVGARERRPGLVDGDEEVRPGARRLLGLQRVAGGLGVELRHHRDDPGVVDDHGEGAVELLVPVALERLPGASRLLQVLVDLGVGDGPGAGRGDRDRPADGDQDQQGRREEDLEGEGEPGRLRRRKLQPADDRPGERRGSRGGLLSSAHLPIPTAADTPCRTCSGAGRV